MAFNTNVSAQFLGNEWINYNQQYYKFPITQTSIYHLDSLTLATAGINVSSFDARNLQLFFRGREIPIYVQGEGDGIFNAADFIEFFGEGNDGWLDSSLYINGTADQMNPAYSIFNDTSAYYLTWNSSLSNLRFTLETDTDFATYAPSPFYFYKARQGLSTDYYAGEILSGVTSPEYTDGEGYCTNYQGAASYAGNWAGTTLTGLQSTIYTATSVDSYLELRIATRNNPTLVNDHHHQINVADVPAVVDTSLDAYHYYQRNFIVNSTTLAGSLEPFRVNFLNDLSLISRNAFGYYQLIMPQIFDLSNRTQQTMYLLDGLQPKARVDITNFNTLTSTAWIFDLTNNRKVTTIDSAGTLRALIPNDGSGFSKRIYISSDASVLSVPQVLPVSTDPTHYARFRDFQNELNDKDYIIITHASLWSAANIYEGNRIASGYNPVLIDINELYDQFCFGIKQHPNSIRNFLKMTNTFWTKKPDYVFLIGKGIRHTFIRTNPTLYSQSLLPTMGIAPCDNMFAYNISGNDRQYCAIGRLAAASDNSVMDYYYKVVSYETAQNMSPQPEYMKNILHFASAPTFYPYLNGYKSIIEDTLFGGNVVDFNLPFNGSTSDSIRDAFTVGVSLVTVFGHSSGSGFAAIVDIPEEMTNTAYPWYIVNGCLSGDIFQAGAPLISERFVLTPGRAAIGFMASTALGFASTLYTITDSLYRNIGVFDYGKPMGTAHQNAISGWVYGRPNYDIQKINALQFQLHGDPGLFFNSNRLPDLDLQPYNVSIIPPVVTMEMDSFKMKIIVTNLGRTINQPYQLTVTRHYPQPGVPDITYNLTGPYIYYKDTFELYMPVNLATSFGVNTFDISVDIPDYILEMPGLEYSNNLLTTTLNIISSDIIPVYPYKYAVIPINNTPLKASTGDPFAPAKNYKFQLDTTDLFNSPFLRETIINQFGGVVQWDPGVLLDDIFPTDSTAYFWRVGVDSANTGVFYRFKESTFQVITGKYGWGQDHFFQFKDDDYLFIDYNRPNRRFDFVPGFKELHVKTYPTPISPFNFETQYTLDAALQEASGCWIPSFYIFVIDPITLQPWLSHCLSGTSNTAMSFGNSNNACGCRPRSEKLFMYNNLGDPLQYNGLIDLLNTVPNNFYIGAYTFWTPNFSNETFWNDSVVNALEALGAGSIRSLRDSNLNVPYIFYTIKGDTTTTQEVVGANSTTPIELFVDLQNQWNFGTITSELVGPASQWKSFHWQTRSIDANPNNDTAWVSVYGVTASGTENLIPSLSQIPNTTTDIYNLNTMIDSSIYPFVKLYMYTRDDSTVTPAQINHWHVMYEGVPECALNPNLHYVYQDDTTTQGQTLLFSTAIENIGDYDMDSLQIRYYIVDANNTTYNYYVKRDSLRVGQFIIDTFEVLTNNFAGLNTFYVEANPYTPIWQLEQYHFNNIGSRTMYVSGDKLNPLLDVTFDGIHIMNEDIVSGKPFINMQIKDENVLRLLDDTADFEVYLRYPGQSNAVRINFTSPEITFYPATTQANYAKIEFRPDLTLTDGIYELLVNANDKSGNSSGYSDSGIVDFKIKFEVVNATTITNIFNYPNPFSTSTQWVFTLTGSEIPTEFTIRIMTISGVVVREITLNELGPIHVGDNVTSFKWNGTDEYGDKLATGAYIYQVITKVNGEVIDHRNTSADKYFKNNFGKLYIIR